MSVHNSSSVVFLTKSPSPAALLSRSCRLNMIDSRDNYFRTRNCKLIMHSIIAGSSGNGTGGSGPAGVGGGDGGVKKKGVPNSNYVVPLDNSLASAYTSCITRPLSEILRDLNKRIPDNIIKPPNSSSTIIPWFHANRMLSFYAPGWCGEIRDVIFAENGSVTVVYRVTIRGSDGEAHRESSGTVSSSDVDIEDPVAAAEEIAFCRACARFGLGLYLYHEEQML
ncbi:PREDICTED: uncharacterized protein LOC105123140 [Populus euphratica]|uniref:Uncharacterized protein LOC105123140 n=1 Tax=Populus euphratica TaxID=75702 RepID=A0AAJ6U0K9_POPEU|nr:PREDICTED: uncharacterized protein LOC105123140 [Populus euphratica]